MAGRAFAHAWRHDVARAACYAGSTWPHEETRVNAPLVNFGIYGVIIVAVMLFRPGGLIPEQRRQLEFETGVHDQPLMDVRHAPEE